MRVCPFSSPLMVNVRVSWMATCGVLAIGMVTALATGAAATDAGPSPPLQFNRDVRPILAEHCLTCHGFDAKARQADLRLDEAEFATAERDGTFAIKPGDLEHSEVWQRINTEDESLRMPPASAPKPLTAAQKEILRRWIEQGAPYQKHWSFVRLGPVAIPKVREVSWCRNPVDRFILARLEQDGWQPNPEADRETLIRRVAFSLTGLPPTQDELHEFLVDPAPDAYERMVDRYLESPRFGEERAKFWLDVARYADTHGLHLDNHRHMWSYRDWVVNAFNRNLTFDQFTREQLAGDLLPNPTQDQRIATGFNRCNVTTSEGGAIDEEYLYRYAVDRTSTMIEAWMGLTGGCAVCHDHKYDPLTTRDFYSLYAFFNSAADPALDGNASKTPPYLVVSSQRQETQLKMLLESEASAKQVLEEAANRIAGHELTQDSAGEEAATIEDVWLDDLFLGESPGRSSSRNEPVWSLPAEVEPARGHRSLKQASAVGCDDSFGVGRLPLVIPDAAVLKVAVRLDPHATPRVILLNIRTDKGEKSAVWGDMTALDGARMADAQRTRVGDLPTPGAWSELTVHLESLGVTSSDSVQGVTLGLYGGVAWWDNLRVHGRVKRSTDPRSHFMAWWKLSTGKDTPGIPAELTELLKAGPDQADPSAKSKLGAYYLAHVVRETPRELQILRQAYEEARAARTSIEGSLAGTLVFQELPKPRESFVMLRGQYDKPGEAVQPAVPVAFPPLPAKPDRPQANRLDLAEWLLSDDHPLTARVTVNRFWQEIFGRGLVNTSYDFGSRGAPPTHPELLDWLAVRFSAKGWDVKSLCRLLVTSATFRQASHVRPEIWKVDPENQWYARGPRIRLDAEQIRDAALAASGLLDGRMGGPGVKPYQPPNVWEPVGYQNSNTRFYLQDHGSALYRRSLYSYFKRTAPPPFMSNFDAPNREQFCTRRERSNTPLQALQLMNDVQHFEAARALAEHMLQDGGNAPSDRLNFAARRVLSRQLQEAEITVLQKSLNLYVQRYREDEAAAEQVVNCGESKADQSLDPVELAAYTMVANLLLNLDETITRN